MYIIPSKLGVSSGNINETILSFNQSALVPQLTLGKPSLLVVPKAIIKGLTILLIKPSFYSLKIDIQQQSKYPKVEIPIKTNRKFKICDC
jgi:hypothetical protein